ncbi:MAG: hypothetical protein WAT79_01145 [Saprospiraceae bacterium]
MKNIITYNRFIVIGILLGVWQPLFCQKDTSKLAFNQVEVVKAFEVKLKEVKRITINPTIEITSNIPIKYKYNITSVPANIKYPEPEIRALAMQPDDPIHYYNGFVKGGYGTMRSPHLEAGYHKVRKELFSWGAHAKYVAVDDKDSILNQKMSNIHLNVQGNYVWKNNVQLSGSFENNFKNRRLWNEFESPDSLVEDRNINKVGLTFGLHNIDLSKYKLNYAANVGFKSTRINDQNSFEQIIFVDGQVEKHRTDRLAFVLNAKMEVQVLKSEDWTSLFNLITSPYFILRFGNFKSILGVSAILSNDKNAIFPKIDLSYPIYKKHVQIFVGSDQKVFSNNLYQLSDINPFLNTNLNRLTNTISKEIYGGLKGEYSFLSYQANFGVKTVRGQSYFNFDSLDVARFRLEYDDTKIVFFSGNLDFKIHKNVSLGGWLTQNTFRMDTLARPWHLPELITHFYAKSSFFEDKLKLNLAFTFNDRIDFSTSTDSISTSEYLFDVQASVEYFPLHNVGIYIKGNNLLNNNFQRWYGYRNLGIQVAGGIMIKF